MNQFARYLPFLDLRDYRLAWFGRDALAALAVLFVSLPQGIAYAVIAGLPPVAGLYAAAFPAVVGGLFRSSRHVVSGPTNAVSLIVGTGVAAAAGRMGASPAEVGITLALLVGILQTAAGLFRLEALVDFVSTPVVRGYITGAAVLIAAGQLPNLTGTAGTTGNLVTMVYTWVSGLSATRVLTVTVAVGTFVFLLVLRRLDPRIPALLVAILASTVAVALLGLDERGLRVVGDIARTSGGVPGLTLPSLSGVVELFSVALACTVLSLVEAISVARAIAVRSRQRLDMRTEFTGQGLANVAAAFTGGYPVGGSLGRSMLNWQSGASSRLAGTLSGMGVLLTLWMFGPLVDRVPIAGLAALLLVIAWDLVDLPAIRKTLLATGSDRIAFVATLLGTWMLRLDHAIYLGVGISLVLFLRQARMLSVRELAIGDNGRFREVSPELADRGRICSAIRVLNVTGPLFFAVAGELEAVLDDLAEDRDARVLILRLRQVRSLDLTTAGVFESVAERLREDGRALLLIGLRPSAMGFLDRTGAGHRIGRDNVFPVEDEWFSAMGLALRRALEITGEHRCGRACPFEEYLTVAYVP